MNKLYDIGYQTIKSPAELKRLCNVLEAVVFDVRFSARSRIPGWSGSSLMTFLGLQYFQVPEFGNKLYYTNQIQIADYETGKSKLLAQLEKTNVILMCACWDRKTCHRLEIINKLGIPSEQLPMKLQQKLF